MRVRAVSQRLTFAATGVLAALSVQATEPVVADYMLACQGCHLADGSGHPAHGVPSLKGYVGNFLRVDGGREFLLRVPGVAQSELSDARLANVLNWMLKTFSPHETPADTPPFTAEEVASLRRQPLVTIAATRQELIARIKRLEPLKRRGGA